MQLGALAHKFIFTTLDLSNEFLQIPFLASAKKKSAFVMEETVTKLER